MDTFERLESNVQSYARSFPARFDRAEGATIFDADGRSYIDFLAGAGSLNYGHNHPALRDALIDYISAGGIAHSLDLHTVAKEKFLLAFEARILRPRGMDYVLQFTGPTGANAVEAALKLARRITRRSNIVAFSNGFHGVTLGALAATGNGYHRAAAGQPLSNVTRMPYDGYLGQGVDTLDFLERALADPSSGIELPAAAIVECVQGEGGLNVASVQWLKRLERICRRHEILLIVDDIQAGCGRTGNFFSFEAAGICPDIVTLSKSISGFGLPMAVVLIKRDLDQWNPGEHNGTFRGNNHAFVTAAAALDTFWSDDALRLGVNAKTKYLGARLAAIKDRFGRTSMTLRGCGLMQGIVMPSAELAKKVSAQSFKRGLIIELAGSNDEVVKCMPPLTITEATLGQGLDILEAAMAAVMTASSSAAA